MNWQCPFCQWISIVQESVLRGIYLETDIYCTNCGETVRYSIRCERIISQEKVEQELC